MGARIRKSSKPYKELGMYMMVYGRRDVEFSFSYPVKEVLISATSDTYPICQGDLNWFAVTMLPHGFILSADVRSDMVEVTWVTIAGHRDGSEDFVTEFD